MISAFSTQHKFQSKRDETLLLQTDLSKANTVIPKPIQWKDVNLPDEWILEGATAPVIPKQLEPNTELQNVTQYSDGKVKLSFRRSTSSRFSDKDSCSSIPSLERKFSKIPSVINLPFQPVKSQPRFSTSDIPSSSIHSVDYTTSIPHPIYTSSQHEQRKEEKEPSPPTSPTFSAVIENVSKTSQKLIQESKSDFAKAIREQLDRIEASSSSSRKIQIAPNSAQSSKICVLEQDNISIASSDIEAFKEQLVSKANKIHWELALPTVKSPPDLAIDNRPSALNQSRFNASSVYEWNIDGMSEYNILGLLQQMPMAANAYKTQSGTSDKAIAEILVAGFTGQLKGWWDHLLTKQQQLDILNYIQTYENGAPILDEFNSPIQDAVATLILTISLHFIGDPSHLRDKNAELLHNLRCRKLSEFQSYKTTFFTRLFLRDNANHVTWKEKFLTGLPTLLREKVRNSIKALYDNRIPYDELTYDELVSFVNKKGLKICQDLKLQKRLKWELRKSNQELGSFCKQFNYDPFKGSTFKDCNESSNSEYSMTGDNDPLQVDELMDSDTSESSSSDSDIESRLKKINVLTKDQETFLELVKHISDPTLQKEYLDKLLKTLEIMPPKRRDKGKGVLKDPEPLITTSKTSPATPPKEKLLSSAMPIKSWIDIVEEQEHQEAQSKAITSHEQVWMWNFNYHTQDSQLILQRTFKVKWWSKFDEQSKLSKATVQAWLSSRGLLTPSIQDVKAQSTFLAQRTKAQSLLASAKTEEEYFKVMQQLLASRSEPSVASFGSSSSGDAEPFISLGDDNEDDCFGIFSPIKHS
ncbi:hypothetical protein KPL70_016954 [Citrus sinensis]|nr:hypothetical protein KPL70_016954 [Citrus sinensis]